VTGDPLDLGKFKVPTLRNIAVTAPYMHDGRFSTLLEVVEHYNSGVDSLAPNLDPDMHVYAAGLGLSAQEKLDLIAFMESFTDTEFLTNDVFSDPH
jgi:cytochrome c peroxidase